MKRDEIKAKPTLIMKTTANGIRFLAMPISLF